MLRKHWKLVSLFVLAGLVLCIGAVATKQTAEQEKAVSIDQVPEAVKATILAEAKGGTIGEIEMETENGQTAYEAEVTIDGQKVEIKVADDGKLLGKEADDEDDDDEDDDDEDDDDEGDDDDEDEDEDEEQVSIDQVPAAVKDTILAQGGTVKEIESENENGQTVYEADVIIDGQEVEIKVAVDGNLLSKEVEDEDEDD
jgi:uncharacterized membrane protein YkoI